MPAKSAVQRRTMGACEHGAPLDICKRIHMTHKQLHDFASTPDAGLPERAPKRNSYRKNR